MLKQNCYYKKKIKGVSYKIFEGYLSYKPKFCQKCGVLFDEFKSVKNVDNAMVFICVIVLLAKRLILLKTGA